ncbi:MAG: hypothetical protein OEV62_03300 [Actinomycetota bacterium]|nr:hypothetical protein [Actinomycetota bacterium]MDH4352285.1 hypothetical protein [Gemmatimonadota bacterium]
MSTLRDVWRLARFVMKNPEAVFLLWLGRISYEDERFNSIRRSGEDTT